MSTFSQFIQSSYFSQWLATNRAVVSGISCERMMIEPQVSIRSTVFQDSEDINTTTDRDAGSEFCPVDRSGSDMCPGNPFAATAISYLDTSDFKSIVRSQSWLSTILLAAESLPVPFSIASADNSRYGFPLIYVNPRFEALTGYDRHEILGRNCKFLQQYNTECLSQAEKAVRDAAALHNERKLMQLREVLARGKAATIELINYRKDGTMFHNYILLKPIFDQRRRYRYVIGLQFEVRSGDTEYSSQQKLSNRNLFNLLPDQLIVDEEEESGHY
jgi:PAS domain S-box-containing protein